MVKLLTVFCALLLVCLEAKAQTKYNYWIDEKYKECLKTQLPCKCGDNIESFNFLITSFDKSNPNQVWVMAGNEPEFAAYNLQNEGNGTYYFTTEKSKSVYSIQIKSQKLSFFADKKKSKSFILYDTNDSLNLFRQTSENFRIISQTMQNRGKPLSKYISLRGGNCECNFEMGNKNIISFENSVKIYELIQTRTRRKLYALKNTDRKTAYRKIVKKIIAVFDWH